MGSFVGLGVGALDFTGGPDVGSVVGTGGPVGFFVGVAVGLNSLQKFALRRFLGTLHCCSVGQPPQPM